MTVLNWKCQDCRKVFRSAMNFISRRCRCGGELYFLLDTRPMVADGRLLRDALRVRFGHGDPSGSQEAK